MEFRTDLAMESCMMFQGNRGEIPGVRLSKERKFGLPVTVVEVKNKQGEQALGREKGTYITMELNRACFLDKNRFRDAAACLALNLRQMLSLHGHLPVMVSGLGNRDITPDAVGPMTADKVLVTRHMLRESPELFGHLRPVSATVPGVLGNTGIESAHGVCALAKQTEAAAVIAVDAIAARDTARLCNTIQLSDTGISPGSGIGNNRLAINRETVGVPVYSIGIPTVTDAGTMARDYLDKAGVEVSEEKLHGVCSGMLVSCSDIDRRVREMALLVATGINYALQNELSLEEVEALMNGN